MFIKWSLFSRVCELLDLDRLGEKEGDKEKKNREFCFENSAVLHALLALHDAKIGSELT